MRKKDNPKRGRSSSTIILIVIFVIGLFVLLYPSLSNYYNSIYQSHAVLDYDMAVAQMDKTEEEKLLAEAQQYNEEIKGRGFRFVNGEPEDETYRQLLNIDGNGMMGYITIKKLQVMLPIYHGTADAVLSVGAGHLEGTSLPIGGESTHAVITGHRGLPSSTLFTDLDQLERGDTFSISVFGQTLTYAVDDIAIVTPAEASTIRIIPGEDRVTLITCTPYAVNTHRLLVHGVRTDTPQVLIVPADAIRIDPVIVSPLVAAPMLLVLLIILLSGGTRQHKRITAEELRAHGDGKDVE